MEKTPNVVMIVADQVSARHISCLGDRQVKTPNIDRIARAGVGFTKAICQAPLCMPSRASFNTGLYPHAVNVTDNAGVLPEGIKTIAQYLGENGYITGGYGHIGGNGLEKGYFEKCDMPDSPMTKAWSKEQLTVTGNGGLPHSYRGVLPYDEKESFDAVVTDYSIAFLNKYGNKDEPFFLQTNFYKPHTPWIVPQKYINMYNPDELELPNSWDGLDMKDKHPIFTDNVKAIGMDILDKEERRKHLAYYYACISYIDEKVGRILRALEENDLMKNTVIIFMSDHGDFGLEHGTAGKMGTFYDCLVNVPLIISNPYVGYRHNVIDDSLVELVDISPTILDMCHIRTDTVFHGESRVGLLKGSEKTEAQLAFSEVRGYGEASINNWINGDIELKPRRQDPFSAGPLAFLLNGRMLIKDKYKLIYYGDGFVELYDLASDKDEMNNIASHPENKEIIAELKEEMLKLIINTPQYEVFQHPIPYHYKSSAMHHIPDEFMEEKLKWDKRRKEY